jgi:3-oxoacyl-[acyl-carrier protein] reductase
VLVSLSALLSFVGIDSMTYVPSDRPIRALDFHQIQVGDEMELSHRITQSDVDAFAALTGDFNPLHLDKAFARKTQFRRPVAHGMLSAAFISTMIGMLLPGSGSLWTAQTLEFLNPAFVDDTIKVTARVKQKSIATRSLVLQITITNQNGLKLVSGESTLKQLELQKERNLMLDEAPMVILVTGSGGGIGAAIAKKLAGQGHFIIVSDWRLAEAERVSNEITEKGGRALALQADISNVQQVEKLFAISKENIGAVQALVHCASPRNALHPFDELSWESVQQHLDVQVKGAFNCAQSALPDMLSAQAGIMVFIGSIAVDGIPPAQQADYVLAKAALVALARCLAVEYGPKGIRVNVVAPGMTQTDMIAHIPEKARMLTRMQTPLRRLAKPDDIAGVVAFLLSPGASHITGTTIRVNGGAGMQ